VIIDSATAHPDDLDLCACGAVDCEYTRGAHAAYAWFETLWVPDIRPRR
jgi:hypothetical protein